MIREDFHVHTTYCDGKNTPEEMVLAAIEKGMTRLGFSGHAYQPFDEEPCMSVEGTAAYKREIAALKEKYRGQIEIFCGVEQEYFSPMPTDGYDYVIGSVHYVKVGDDYLCVDQAKEEFVDHVRRYFGGDFMAMAEEYFRLEADVVRKTHADIIGHFDIFTKFNEGGCLFDESDPRYVAAWKAAVDALIPYGKPFEINTGAVCRGHRSTPYPAVPILRYIREKGGSVILSGDTHRAEDLCAGFERWETRLW